MYVNFILNWKKMFDIHTQEVSKRGKIIGLYILGNTLKAKKSYDSTYVGTPYKTKKRGGKTMGLSNIQHLNEIL